MGFETKVILGPSTVYIHLNFVPMGFETLHLATLLEAFWIWTLSLWDLKLGSFSIDKNISSIWTLSLWDLKPAMSSSTAASEDIFELCPYGIWNSLSDVATTFFTLFELCPYGIWNESFTAEWKKSTIFELCPYGIWNALHLKRIPSQSYLNFVCMGFETKLFH